jgi:hypothetical protein
MELHTPAFHRDFMNVVDVETLAVDEQRAHMEDDSFLLSEVFR